MIASAERVLIPQPLNSSGETRRSATLAAGAEQKCDLRWSLTLDAPLRAETGELYVSVRDQKRKKWEWRLPFVFERR